jgi:DNA-binding transcriptional LysR family regulator
MSGFHNVDLKRLRIFVAVVECGGFTAAENLLNISCSTISKAVTDLEVRLGAVLCRRGRAGFELTEQGEKLYQSSNKLFAAVAAHTAELDSLEVTGPRMLRVAVVDNSTSDPKCPLVHGLKQLQLEHANVVIDLHIMTPNEITLGLLKDELDLGITLIHRKVTGLCVTHLYEERVAPYVAIEHETLWRQPRLSLDDIASLRLTTYTHREPGSLMLPDDSGQFYFCPQIEGVLILILSGKHVGMLPEFYAKGWVDSGQIKELLVDGLSLNSPIVAMNKVDGLRHDLVSRLIELMQSKLALSQ